VSFLHTLSKTSVISCTQCHKSTKMVPAGGDVVTPLDVARYELLHVHGTPGRGWDVADADPDTAEPVR